MKLEKVQELVVHIFVVIVVVCCELQTLSHLHLQFVRMLFPSILMSFILHNNSLNFI